MPTIFDRLTFPPYRFQEYPKMVYPPSLGVYGPADDPDPSRRSEPHLVGKPVGVTVYSEEEEEEIMTSPEADAAGLENLRTQAEQLHIQVDGRWGIGRLRDEIAKAEAA